MKKFLLFATAIAALSMNAQDVKVEKMWESETLPASVNDVRQGFGMGGKIYIQDKAEQKVLVFDQNGQTETTYPGGTNCGISYDQAGNIIVSLAAFPNAWTCDGETALIRVINPTTGDTKEYAIPEEAKVEGRHDFLGHAQGDLFTDGVLYLQGATNSGVVKLVITDGEVNVDDSYEATVDPAQTATSSNVINVYKNLDGEDAILYVYRAAVPRLLQADGDNFTAAAICNTLPGRSNSNGADAFVLGGKEYVVYPSAPTIGNYFDGFSICEVGAEEALFVKEPAATANINGYQCDWVNAEVVDANTVIVYQYAPGKSMGAWKVSIPSTAVADVNAAKTATGVKYVNLAGVQSNVPFEGVNMVVTSYSDGTQNTVKVVK